MLVKYYNNEELAYTNRQRYHSFSFVPFSQEEQKSILLGDGATTQIKTKKSNICNYVSIDDTRWYVTSYVYLNGGQVQLNLQRDVIGEFGISGCFGKIERGYTETFLKNRKELGLNQILKERKKIYPSTNIYGNYSVNTHEDEMWGILYLVKPTEINPSTGEVYPEQVNISIPAFAPAILDYPYIKQNESYVSSLFSNSSITYYVRVRDYTDLYRVIISFDLNDYTKEYSARVSVSLMPVFTTITQSNFLIEKSVSSETERRKYVESMANSIATLLLGAGNNAGNVLLGYELPFNLPNVEKRSLNYDGVCIRQEDKIYKYTETISSSLLYGKTPYVGDFTSTISTLTFSYNGNNFNVTTLTGENINFISQVAVAKRTITYKELTTEESGIFTIDVNQTLVDEPYVVLAFPLFDCKIEGNGEVYNIEKKKAFMVFNSVIQFLGGENPYLVDAQIYPYCPVLTSVPTKVVGCPFFSINSTCYVHSCEVQLLPSVDIKKEYIQRQYSIVSPEQTGKFNFNFYDYKTKVNNQNGINFESIIIEIKTALKPFSIISSAVIIPDNDSLIGITYNSDLRGSQPSSNGFECSLSSNAFETYKRQNSNYQQIFALQKEELQKQHSVELVNDITATVVNTASATAMSAIAGNAMGDAGLLNFFGSKAATAGISAGVGGGLVGGAMTYQTIKNQELRDYEQYVQQQTFDLNIGTIKNLPNTISRISTFNELLMKDFCYIVEIYECSDLEKEIVDNFIEQYAYGIGVFDNVINYQKDGWFLRSTLIKSNYPVNLHLIAEKELMGGIYLYEQV